MFLALTMSTIIPLIHVDGAFQTASTLHRIDSGQVIGQDFQSYLGIGISYLIYPIFKLLGGDFGASIKATMFLTYMLSFSAFTMLWMLNSGKINLTIAIRKSFIFFTLSTVTLFFLGLKYDAVTFFTLPGASLRPIRSILPYALAGVFLYLHFKHTIRIRAVVSGFIMGMSLFWTNDYAYTTTGLFGMYLIYYCYQHSENPVKTMSSGIITFIITFYLFGYTTTNGHYMEVLKFNFIDVKTNQWWFFPSYAEELRIYTIQNLSKVTTIQFIFSSAILLVSGIRTLKTRNIIFDMHLFTGAALLLGGLVATTGGSAQTHYFLPFNGWALFTAIYAFTSYFSVYFKQSKPTRFGWASFIAIFVIIIGATLAYEQKKAASNTSKYIYVDELGGHLPKSLQHYVEFARNNKTATVTEEYWGIYSAINKSFGLWQVDSVIHALGSLREQAKNNLKANDYIITTNPKQESIGKYLQWNITSSYWLHGELHDSWEPILKTPWTIVWKKKEPILKNKKLFSKCHFNNKTNQLIFTGAKSGYYQLVFQYKIHSIGRTLVTFSNNYAKFGDYKTSLNLNSNEINTFVKITEATPITINTHGDETNYVDILSCRYAPTNAPKGTY